MSREVVLVDQHAVRLEAGGLDRDEDEGAEFAGSFAFTRL
jgi:hypothetical protein